MRQNTQTSGWVRVCTLAELPLEEAAVTRVSGVQVAIFHTEDGVYAVADRCTHQDASLADGFVEDCSVECPLHASVFDLRTGEPSTPPATEPVRTYDTAVVDGVVYVVEPED